MTYELTATWPRRVSDGVYVNPQSDREYLAWLAAGNKPAQHVLGEAEILAKFTAFIQGRLDSFAQTRMYDGILSACSYVASGVPKFAAEAAYCVGARDATWAKGYEIMAAVTGGARPMPTIEQVEAELPKLAWPQ